MTIPLIKDKETRPGVCYRPRPGLRRIVANNPGPFTYTGTGTYIVGKGTVAIIDPGPDDRTHLDALLTALAGEKIGHILVTHTHKDHSPLAKILAERTNAQICGCAPLVIDDGSSAKVEEAFDLSYAPDIILNDGDVITGPGWTLRAVATPGHTSNHLCYHWLEENALFTGDHVMGWSTSVIVPPDGDMRAYMDSLRRIEAAHYESYWPTHGQPVLNTAPFIAALIRHREDREAAILHEVKSGTKHIPDIVAHLYKDVPSYLHPAAARSVLAHLIKLEAEGKVTAHPRPALDAVFQ